MVAPPGGSKGSRRYQVAAVITSKMNTSGQPFQFEPERRQTQQDGGKMVRAQTRVFGEL